MVSVYVKDKFDIGIVNTDGVNVGMMLGQRNGIPEYSVFDDEYLAAQFFTGVPGYANLPTEKELAIRQDSWRAGFGLDFYNSDEPERYFSSHGMDMRFRGMAIAGPKAEVIPLPPPINIINPTMEGADGWTGGAQHNTFPYSGTYCWMLTGNAIAYQDLTWNDKYRGGTIRFSAQVNGMSGIGYRAGLGIDDGVSMAITNADAADAYEKVTATKVLATNASRLRICFVTNATGGYFDAVTEPIVTNAVISAFVDYNDKVYCARGKALYCLNSLGTGFDLAFTCPSNITALEPFTDDSLYIACNTANTTPYWALNTAGGYTVATNGVNAFQFFRTVHGANPTLWGNSSQYQIRSSLSPANANAWSNVTNVGSSYYNITHLMTKSGALYIMKEDMPYYLDSTGAVQNDLAPLLRALAAVTSGKNAFTDGDKIWIPCGTQGLLEIDGTTLTWRSPSDFMTNLSMFNGRISSICADDYWKFITVDNGTVVQVLAGRMESISSGSQWVWHPIAEVPVSNCETSFISSITEKRLYIASAAASGDLYYLKLYTGYGDPANDTNRNFQTNTWLETPWLHAEFRDTTKAYPKVSVLLGHPYNINVFFDAYYKKIEDSDYTYIGQLVGTANSRIATLFTPQDASNVNPVSTMVRARFVANTAYTDKTPILFGYNIQGILYPNKRNIIACTVRAAEEVTLMDGTRDIASFATIDAVLDESRNATWPVTIYDVDGNQKFVKFLPLPSSVPRWIAVADERTRKVERHYNLLLQEVTLS